MVIIGIVALGLLITVGVEEIRFRLLNRVLLSEVKTLQAKNQALQAKNDSLSEEIKTLKVQLEAKTQEYEKKFLN